MEKKYRLLDVGESWDDVASDEMLTVSVGWRSVSGYGTVQAHTAPMRRPDDGKGKYVLAEEFHGTEFWRCGIGWRLAKDLQPAEGTTIWRKAREEEKPTHSLWVVIQTSGNKDDWMVSHSRKHWLSWESACAEAKQLAREGGDGAEFAVAHIDRTFKCVVEVVEKEVGK